MSDDNHFEELFLSGLLTHAVLQQLPVRVLPDGRELHLEGLMGGRARLKITPPPPFTGEGYNDVW